MKRNENILIGMLICTTVILAVMFLGSWNAQKAYASAPDRAGDYIMITGARSDSNDLLYVIDVPNQKMVVYYIDPIQNQVQVVDDRVDFSQVFKTPKPIISYDK